MDKDPLVVIVGGGFGGLNTARGLAKAPVRVTLVDKRNFVMLQWTVSFMTKRRQVRIFPTH